MFSCVVVDASHKAALKRSSRILAKYLAQIGPTTYQGSLSSEGLAALQAELVGARSRYLSVACWLVRADHRSDLLWVVGSKSDFDEEAGLYAHRWRTLGPRFKRAPATPTSRLLALCVKAAALTHDLGKMSDAFQQKLRAAMATTTEPAVRAEYLRHDALSYLMLRRMGSSLEAMASLPRLDGAALEVRLAFPSASAFAEAFRSELDHGLKTLKRSLAPGKRPSTQAAPMTELIPLVIAFLALTHHRLPGAQYAKSSDYTYEASIAQAAEAYLHDKLAPDYQSCLRFSRGNILEDAGAPSVRGAQLLEVLNELQAALASLPPDFDTPRFLRTVLAFGRPTLVLPDHLGSAMKTDIQPECNQTLLGNTLRRGDAPALPGDSLSGHVGNVLRHARRSVELLHTLMRGDLDAFPQLSVVAQRNIDAKRSPVGRFAWQHEAHAHLLASTQGHPTFCVVTAETGSGKTIASAQIARALGSRRFTYCLGLRSLTLQTGASYEKDLGLTARDLATVIGDAVAQKAFDAQAEAAGSESQIQDDYLLAGVTQDAAWASLLEDPKSPVTLADAVKAHRVDFVSTPVVVCTIDQLIGITQLRTVKRAFDYLRLYSADLVLDEVDNYSPEELKHLMRLVFLAGLARKHVICLSATMGYLHTRALLSSYLEGLKANAALTGLDEQMQLACVSNLTPPRSCLLANAGHLETGLSLVDEFNQAAIAAQAKQAAKVHHQVLECTALDFDAILKEALRLHAQNHILFDQKEVSVGFVRMNTVGSARALAAHLYATGAVPEDTALSVLCYHSKHTGLHLSVIEGALNVLTNRKGLAPGEGLSPEACAQFVAPLATVTGKRKLIFVVVTTSILETGRDHDYDWAILEPSSHRSLIQSAGRVRRHREASVSTHNLSLIAHPARALKQGCVVPAEPVRVFSRPGPLTLLNEGKTNPAVKPQDAHQRRVTQACLALAAPPLEVDAVLDCTAHGLLGEAYPDGVRSAIALRRPATLDNALALLEQYVLHVALLKEGGEASAIQQVSEGHQQAKAYVLTDWAYLQSFRGSTPQGSPVWQVSPRARQETYAVLDGLCAEDGSRVSYESPEVQVGAPGRVMLALGRDGSPEEVVRARLTEELCHYRARGVRGYELLHLARYVPTADSGVAAPLKYHVLLGFA